MSLAAATNKNQSTNYPSQLIELVGFKHIDGREAIIGKLLDENLMAGDIYTFFQGKAPNEELELKRRTISSFSNINSKYHIKPGAIVQLDQVKVNKEKKTGEAIFIKDLHNGELDDPRKILVALAKPLPVRANKGNAWVEVINPNGKKVASNKKDFYRALVEAFRDSALYTQSNGLTEYAQNIILLSDNNNSRPHTIFIRNVVIDPAAAVPQYRYPDLNDLKKQFLEDETIAGVMNLLDSHGGNFSVNVIPGARILVSSTLSKEAKYSGIIKNFTGKFKIDEGNNALVERELIGYKKSILALWNGVINGVSPCEYTRPQLNEQPESLSIQAPGKLNSASISAEKSKLEDAANVAAAAMAALAGQTEVNASIPVNNENHSAEMMNEKSEDIDNFFAFDESNEDIEFGTHVSEDFFTESGSIAPDQEDSAAKMFTDMANY